MANSAKTPKLIPAAAYVRMSSGKQEASPEQQRAELARLAAREGMEIVQWFSDEAVCGDSGTDERPGLAALEAAVKGGQVRAVLAWHTNRLSRENPFDALGFYNTLRRARARALTSCEGPIDLNTLAGQLVLFVNQSASHGFLREHSAKVLRGKRSNAEAGHWNGARVPFAYQRVEVDAAGHVVQRLAPKQPRSTVAGHHVRLAPVEDARARAAVAYAFERFGFSDTSVRALARELQAAGHPAPNGHGWTHSAVRAMLANPVYAGGTRWNAESAARYHRLAAGEIQPLDEADRGWRVNDAGDVMVRQGTHEGLVDPEVFARVQKRLAGRGGRRNAPRPVFPLTGLLFCAHCGQAMQGATTSRPDRAGNPRAFRYQNYVCSSYDRLRRASPCGHHTLPAAALTKWLVARLAEWCKGEGRALFLEEVDREAKARAVDPGANLRRLEKDAAKLDREVARLVKAIRQADCPELVAELRSARAERDRIAGEVARLATPVDAAREAQEGAAVLEALADRLLDTDPALLRESLKLVVVRIDCRWEASPAKRGGGKRYRLVEGVAELRLPAGSCLLGGETYAGAWEPTETAYGTRRACYSRAGRLFRFSFRSFWSLSYASASPAGQANRGALAGS